MSSPDVETFSTPPTTPMTPEHQQIESTRRSYRPSNLRLQHSASSWAPDIQLDSEPSPNGNINNPHNSPTVSASHANGITPRQLNGTLITPNNLPSSSPDNYPTISPSVRSHTSPNLSPCLLHSQLQVQGGSPHDWARARSVNVLQHHKNMGNIPARKADMQAPACPDDTFSESTSGSNTDREDYAVIGNDDADEEYTGNLTQQLAETAVGVREMSKQLGQCVSSRLPGMLIAVQVAPVCALTSRVSLS